LNGAPILFWETVGLLLNSRALTHLPRRHIGHHAAPGFFGGALAQGEFVHLAAAIAGALGAGIRWNRHVSASGAEKSLRGPLQHGPEFAALDTIRTAHDLIEHFFLVLLPFQHTKNNGAQQPWLGQVDEWLGRGGMERIHKLVPAQTTAPYVRQIKTTLGLR
jgi:hypothetical protein